MSYAAQDSPYRGYGPPPWSMWSRHPLIVLDDSRLPIGGRIGLVILGIVIGSRKMASWSGRGYDRWQDQMQGKMDRMRSKMESFGGGWSRSSGNRAFDEYRTETLSRLEEEQAARVSRIPPAPARGQATRAEFDQLMADRRNHPESLPAPPQG